MRHLASPPVTSVRHRLGRVAALLAAASAFALAAGPPQVGPSAVAVSAGQETASPEVMPAAGDVESLPSERLTSAAAERATNRAMTTLTLAGMRAWHDIETGPERPLNVDEPPPEPESPQPEVPVDSLAPDAIPELALEAYRGAADAHFPGCELRWQVLAGIGRVESNHGRLGARGVTPDGTVWPRILGPRLDGRPKIARIGDTDGGRFDDDPTFDRAVGPMQFIPSSWRTHGRDATGDGQANPDNLFDAAHAAADHLCRRTPGDYRAEGDLQRALYAYNPSPAYVRTVRAWIRAYDEGVVDVSTPVAARPPADDGPALGGRREPRPAADAGPAAAAPRSDRARDGGAGDDQANEVAVAGEGGRGADAEPRDDPGRRDAEGAAQREPGERDGDPEADSEGDGDAEDEPGEDAGDETGEDADDETGEDAGDETGEGPEGGAGDDQQDPDRGAEAESEPDSDSESEPDSEPEPGSEPGSADDPASDEGTEPESDSGEPEDAGGSDDPEEPDGPGEPATPEEPEDPGEPEDPSEADEPDDAAPVAPELPEPFDGGLGDPATLTAALAGDGDAGSPTAAARLRGAWWALTDWCHQQQHASPAACADAAADALTALTGRDPRGPAGGAPDLGVAADADRTRAAFDAGAAAGRQALGVAGAPPALPREQAPSPEVCDPTCQAAGWAPGG